MNPARPLLLPVCLILATAIPASAAHTIEGTVHPDGISAGGLTEDWGDSPGIRASEPTPPSSLDAIAPTRV